MLPIYPITASDTVSGVKTRPHIDSVDAHRPQIAIRRPIRLQFMRQIAAATFHAPITTPVSGGRTDRHALIACRLASIARSSNAPSAHRKVRDAIALWVEMQAPHFVGDAFSSERGERVCDI